MDCAVVYEGRDAAGNIKLEIQKPAPSLPVEVLLVGDDAVQALGSHHYFVAAAVATKSVGLHELARAPEQQQFEAWTLVLDAGQVQTEIEKRSHPEVEPGQVLLRFSV